MRIYSNLFFFDYAHIISHFLVAVKKCRHEKNKTVNDKNSLTCFIYKLRSSYFKIDWIILSPYFLSSNLYNIHFHNTSHKHICLKLPYLNQSTDFNDSAMFIFDILKYITKSTNKANINVYSIAYAKLMGLTWTSKVTMSIFMLYIT